MIYHLQIEKILKYLLQSYVSLCKESPIVLKNSPPYHYEDSPRMACDMGTPSHVTH